MNENKCVCLHKDKEGIVRYVGSGILERANRTDAKTGRGKNYAEYVNTHGKLDIEIVTENLSKLQAEDLERELYDKYKDTVLNYRRPVSVNTMTKSMFDDFLYYDESSCSCLRWKVNVGSRGKINLEAGSLNNADGYYLVGLNGKTYPAHRIVAVIHNLVVDGKVIDHIDRNRSNNKIENLRIVSYQENCNNRSISKNNTSGIQGVSFDKLRNRWVCFWYENQKLKRKNFSISKYANESDAFEAACEHRKMLENIRDNQLTQKES